MSVRVDRDVINALIAGHFADPFSVLGMHQTEAGLEVRALLPLSLIHISEPTRP